MKQKRHCLTSRFMIKLVLSFLAVEAWASSGMLLMASDYEVKKLKVEDVTSTGAVITWEAGEAVQWQVSYSTDTVFADSITTTQVTTQTRYEITGLQNKTEYFTRVRSYNDESDYGAWSDTIGFVTLPGIITEYPWRENFDSLRATDWGGSNNLPLGWRYINTSSYGVVCGCPVVFSNGNSFYYNSASNAVRYCSGYSPRNKDLDPKPQYLILPEMADLNGKQLELFAKGKNDVSSIKIGLMTNPKDTSTFTLIAEQILSTRYREYSFTLSGSGNYVAIMIDAANAERPLNEVYIDDITIESCPKPMNLTAALTPGNGSIATLSWTSAAAANDWVVQYGLDKSFASGTYIERSVNGTPSVDLSGLAPDSVYYVRIRSVIGEDQSDWNGISFIPTNDYNITLNDGTVTDTYVPIAGEMSSRLSKCQFIIPDSCIKSMLYGTINRLAFYADVNNMEWGKARYEVYLAEIDTALFESNTFEDWRSMIKVMDSDSLSIVDGKMEVQFDRGFEYGGGNLLVGIVQTRFGSDHRPFWYGVKTARGASLGGYGANAYMNNISPKTTFYFTPGEAPACERPAGLNISDLKAISATLSWTEEGSCANWIVQYGQDQTFADSSYQQINVDGQPIANLTGLIAETAYYVRVKAVNGEDESMWSRVIVLETPEYSPLPTGITISDITQNSAAVSWEGDCESYVVLMRKEGIHLIDVDFEDNAMPEGWTVEGDATWTVGTGDNSESTGAYRGNYNAKIVHTNNNDKTYLVSPMLDLTGLDEPYLYFWYINREWSVGVDTLGVYYRVNGGEWNELFTTTGGHNTWIDEFIELQGLAANYQIGFLMTDRHGYGVGLDDIQLNGRVDEGEWIEVPVTGNTLNLTDRTPGRKYRICIKSKNLEHESDWSDVYEFNTLVPTYVNSIKKDSEMQDDAWYLPNGVKLNGMPSKPGLYIINGNRVLKTK